MDRNSIVGFILIASILGLYTWYTMPNAEQRWYYFPRMQMDEALLFKTFDSETDGRTRFTIHSSFPDPTAPPDASPRESIETRCLVFF